MRPSDEGFERKNNSRGHCKTWRARSQLPCPLGLSYGISPAAGSKRIWTSGYGDGVHRSLESVQGFRAVGGGNPTREGNRRTDFHIILDQSTRGAAVDPVIGRDGACCCSVLSRASPACRDHCFGNGIPHQWSRHTTWSTSAT